MAPGSHSIGGWVGPRAGLDDVERSKILPIAGLELRHVCPTRSQSLWGMSWLGKVGKTPLHVITLHKKCMKRPHARLVAVSNPRPTSYVIGRFMHHIFSQLFSSVHHTSASQISNWVEMLQRMVSQTPCGGRGGGSSEEYCNWRRRVLEKWDCDLGSDTYRYVGRFRRILCLHAQCLLWIITVKILKIAA
jgi:hypothetical protein